MERIEAMDEGALFWFESHHHPWVTVVMKAASHIGEPKPMLLFVVVAGLGFLLARRPRTAGIVVLLALTAYLFCSGVKILVQRPRPDVVWRQIAFPPDTSFPSGHALNSMADLLMVALVVSRGLRRQAARATLIGSALGLALLIGTSRPYLGVHYPSDVLGGWTAGLAFALLAYGIDLRWGDRSGVAAVDKTPTSAVSGGGDSGADSLPEAMPAPISRAKAKQ
jgi:undecaprenyl-diphosphatase